MNHPSAKVTEQELHAFVDAQLDPERLPAVLAWLEAHPEDAARVQEWQALCRQLRLLFEGIEASPVPERLTRWVLHPALHSQREDRPRRCPTFPLIGTHR